MNENESEEEKKKAEEIIDAPEDYNENGDLRKDETKLGVSLKRQQHTNFFRSKLKSYWSELEELQYFFGRQRFEN